MAGFQKTCNKGSKTRRVEFVGLEFSRGYTYNEATLLAEVCRAGARGGTRREIAAVVERQMFACDAIASFFEEKIQDPTLPIQQAIHETSSRLPRII